MDDLKEKPKLDVDTVRQRHLAAAEFVDAWRIVPRALVAGYGYLVWEVVQWFMALPDPTMSHTALVSTVVGSGAIVIGMYQNSGRKWNGFTYWKKPKGETTKDESASE